jgi:Caspase domain
MANNNYEAQIQQAIPAEFHMISGSHDSQTSADVSNVGKFQLPNPAGRAGGACTSALLQVLYRDGHAASNMSWVELLRQMRTEPLKMGFDQVPQLTSSRLIDVNKTMYIVPPGSTGRRRAVLIGINYGTCRACMRSVRRRRNCPFMLLHLLPFVDSLFNLDSRTAGTALRYVVRTDSRTSRRTGSICLRTDPPIRWISR